MSAGSSIEFNARQIILYLHTASSIDSSLRNSARVFILSESFHSVCGKPTSQDFKPALLEHWQAANASFEGHLTGDLYSQ